ncbi:MAG: DNA repair protein RecO [Pirellulales bacterium]
MASSEKATAIILRVVDFSETSCVVTLFTREFGKLSGLAKGARRLKGPFESALDLLALCRIVFLPRSGDALNLLTEAKLERRFRPNKGSLACLYASYYIAELLTELTDHDDPHQRLFDLAEQTLVELAHGGPVPVFVLRFELMSLRILGHLPSLEQCVGCGTTVSNGIQSRNQEGFTNMGARRAHPTTRDSRERRLSFSLLEGGVLCRTCRPGKRQVVSVSNTTIDILRQFARPDSDDFRRLPITAATGGELRAVLNQYLNHLIGKQLRMHAYL